MTDKEVLDSLAATLNEANPFPELVFFRELRAELRATGRVCVDPDEPAPDPNAAPSGY